MPIHGEDNPRAFLNHLQDMAPGPELDRLVAEKVMHWRWLEDLRVFIDQRGYYRETVSLNHGTKPFHPSQDMSDAWEVVERMRLDDYRFVVIDEQAGEAYAAVMHYRRPIIPSEMTRANTAPLAICRAALKATPT